MSHAALAAVLRLEDVSAGERLTALSLASFANREHRAWPGTPVEAGVPDLRILGVLIAASDQRWRIAQDATTRMTADRMRVLPMQIPRAVRVASAPRYRAPTVVLEPDSMVSHAYRHVAQHILQELGR